MTSTFRMPDAWYEPRETVQPTARRRPAPRRCEDCNRFLCAEPDEYEFDPPERDEDGEWDRGQWIGYFKCRAKDCGFENTIRGIEVDL